MEEDGAVESFLEEVRVAVEGDAAGELVDLRGGGADEV